MGKDAGAAGPGVGAGGGGGKTKGIKKFFSKMIKRGSRAKSSERESAPDAPDNQGAHSSLDSPRQSTSQQVASQQVDSPQVVSQLVVSQQRASQQLVSQQVASQQVASQQVVSQQVASQQVASPQVASQQVTSPQGSSQQVVSQQVPYQQVVSQQVASQQVTSPQVASQQGSSQQVVSQQVASQQGASKQVASQQVASQQRVPQAQLSPRVEQRAMFCPIDPPAVEPVIVRIEPHHDKRPAPHPTPPKAKGIPAGKGLPKNCPTDHIVRPRPIPGIHLTDPRSAPPSPSQKPKTFDTQSSHGVKSQGGVSSTTVLSQNGTARQRSPSQQRLPGSRPSSSAVMQIPVQASPFQRNFQIPIRGQHTRNESNRPINSESRHEAPPNEGQDKKGMPFSAFSGKYRGSLKQNHGNKLIHNPIVYRPPASPRTKPNQSPRIPLKASRVYNNELENNSREMLSQQPKGQPSAIPNYSLTKDIFGRLQAQSQRQRRQSSGSPSTHQRHDSAASDKENQSSQGEDASHDIIPRKKRRPRSSNSLSREPVKPSTEQEETIKAQKESRGSGWRSRLSTPFKSSPSIPNESMADIEARRVQQESALSSRSHTSDQWEKKQESSLGSRSQASDEWGKRSALPPTSQCSEQWGNQYGAAPKPKASDQWGSQHGKPSSQPARPEEWRLQQVLDLAARTQATRQTPVPQQPVHSQPNVIHYHLNIQNCDGLNIHVNSPDAPNSEFALTIEQEGDLDSTLEWGEPLASSTLRRESLALHDQLVSNQSDEESVTDSMAPLNLDDTRSDFTGDTTALMDMDAWCEVQQMSVPFAKIHQQLAMADGFSSRNKPIRLSQRGQGTSLPPSPRPFNPPWRQTSKTDSTTANNGISASATSASITNSGTCKPEQSSTRTTGAARSTTRAPTAQTPQPSGQSVPNQPKPSTPQPTPPSMESTGTQFPSLSRRTKPLHNRTTAIDLQEGTADKPVAKVAPRSRGPTQVASPRAPPPPPPQQTVSSADRDALLVQYLVNNPPDNFSETTETLSIDSDDQFTLTDDEGSPNANFRRFGLASTIQPTLRRTQQGERQQYLDADSDEDVDRENHRPSAFHVPVPRQRVRTLEERVAIIRDDLVRVPGVLIVSTRRNRIIVFLSQERPNVEGVARFMQNHHIERHEFECEVLPWRYRTSNMVSSQPAQMVQ